MMIVIEEVEFGSPLYKTLLTLRYEILRKPIGMELRKKDIALDHIEYHIGAFDNNKTIGCVLLRPLGNDAVQLRQMAVTDAYQGKGIGAKLVIYAEQLAIQKEFNRMETRARKTAFGFYTKLGYVTVENAFTDEHTLTMSKSLIDKR